MAPLQQTRASGSLGVQSAPIADRPHLGPDAQQRALFQVYKALGTLRPAELAPHELLMLRDKGMELVMECSQALAQWPEVRQ